MQSGKKRVIKNAIYLSGASYIGMISSGVLTILMARYLGVSDFGKYVTIFSFISFGSILADFGIPPIIVRNVSKDLSLGNTYFFNCCFLLLLFSVIAFFVINGAAFAVYDDKQLKFLILIASLSFFPNAISATCGGLFRAFEYMKIPSLINALMSIFFFLIMSLILFTATNKLFALIIAHLCISLLYIGVIIRVLKKLVRLNVQKIDYSLCLSVLKESFAVAFIRMFGIINQRIDIIMLSTMSGVSTVGFYGVSSRLIKFVNVPFAGLGMSLLPRVSSSSRKSQSLKRIYGEAQKFYLFFAFLIAIVVFVLSKEIISILFGSDYVAGQSHIALRILILSFLFNKISGPAGVVILSLKERMNKLIPFAFAVALLSVTLNLFLIPRYGIIGASFATLTCAMVMTAIKLFLVKQIVKVKNGVS